MTTITHTRGNFPVTDKFAMFCPPEFLTMSHEALESERQRLLQLSNKRAPWSLTTDELARLAQVTHVINVHRSLDVFDDWKPGDLSLAEADRLHGNMRHHDCGCKLHVAFDHYGEAPAIGHRIHTLCHDHRQHTDIHKLMPIIQSQSESKAKDAKIKR